MARRFLTNDTLTCSMGSAPTSRAGTTLLLIRAYDSVFDLLSTNSDFISGLAGTSPISGTFVSGGNIFSANDFGSGLAGPSDKNTWYVIGATKVSGNNTYQYTIAPVGGSWTQATSGSSVDGSGVDSIVFGKGVIGGGKFDIAAAAQWATPLSIAAIQALGTTSMDSWLAGSPSAAWQFNQTSTATNVNDLVGSANQTALSGTSVVADPVGWTYHTSTTPFTKDVVERYRVFNGFTKDVVETYRVFNALTKDVVERYRVTNAFSKDVVETYRVLNAFTKDVVERYRIFAAFSVDVVERYRVLGVWSKDVVERYTIFAAISKDIVERYRIYNAFAKDIVERYSVGDRDVLPADIIAYLSAIDVKADLSPTQITAYL